MKRRDFLVAAGVLAGLPRMKPKWPRVTRYKKGDLVPENLLPILRAVGGRGKATFGSNVTVTEDPDAYFQASIVTDEFEPAGGCCVHVDNNESGVHHLSGYFDLIPMSLEVVHGPSEHHPLISHGQSGWRAVE